MNKVHDISLPLTNNMWSYKPEWRNEISDQQSLASGGTSNVYRFNLVSHTGTYIETAAHRLPISSPLSDLDISNFYRPVSVVVLDRLPDGGITLSEFLEKTAKFDIQIKSGMALIIASGYGQNHEKESYISDSPYFERDLVEFLGTAQLGLLGVDTPRLEKMSAPYDPVGMLFKASQKMLLLAPLHLDLSKINSGQYLLSCAPLAVQGVSGCLCRPLLIEV